MKWDKNQWSQIGIQESEIPLYLDSDGVFMDFSSSFYRCMKEEHGIVAINVEPSRFDYADVFPDIDRPHQFISAFIDSTHFQEMKPYAGAIEAIKAQRERFQKIIVVTSCGDDPHVQKSRLKSYEAGLDGQFDDVIFLPLGGCKKEVMSKLPKGAFIDDQMRVLRPVVEAGHKGFLFDRNYNQDACPNEMQSFNIHRINCISQV